MRNYIGIVLSNSHIPCLEVNIRQDHSNSKHAVAMVENCIQMVCSQNYGPLLVTDDITAPNMQGNQNRTLILGTTLSPKPHIPLYNPYIPL